MSLGRHLHKLFAHAGRGMITQTNSRAKQCYSETRLLAIVNVELSFLTRSLSGALIIRVYSGRGRKYAFVPNVAERRLTGKNFIHEAARLRENWSGLRPFSHTTSHSFATRFPKARGTSAVLNGLVEG